MQSAYAFLIGETGALDVRAMRRAMRGFGALVFMQPADDYYVRTVRVPTAGYVLQIATLVSLLSLPLSRLIFLALIISRGARAKHANAYARDY